MRVFPCWLLVSSALLGGCASVTRFNGIALKDDAVFVSGVTPFRQDKTHACGAVCLAAVAAHWGIAPAEFKAKFPQSASDATGADLEVMAEKLGLQAFAYRGSINDLQDNLGKGRPVVVMIPMPLLARGGLVAGSVFNLWNEFGPRPPHWVVVVGLLGEDRMIINDPASGPLLLKKDRFQKWWAQNENLCVLIVGQTTGRTAANP